MATRNTTSTNQSTHFGCFRSKRDTTPPTRMIAKPHEVSQWYQYVTIFPLIQRSIVESHEAPRIATALVESVSKRRVHRSRHVGRSAAAPPKTGSAKRHAS